jgi:hypothetical protein
MRNHGTDPRTRGTLLNERLAAIKEIWTKDEAEFHGEHIDFDPILCWPKPVQHPHPPIYIGGDGQVALARVAAHGDGWTPHSVDHPARARPQLNRSAPGPGPATVEPVGRGRRGRTGDCGVRVTQLRIHRRLRGGGGRPRGAFAADRTRGRDLAHARRVRRARSGHRGRTPTHTDDHASGGDGTMGANEQPM